MTGYRFIDDVEEAIALGLAGPHDRRVHLHTLRGRPLVGATTAKSIIGDKTHLFQWYADMAAIAGLKRGPLDIQEEYENAQSLLDKREKQKAKRELDKKYPAYAEARRAAVHYRDEKASEGTFRHGLLEEYVKAEMRRGSGSRKYNDMTSQERETCGYPADEEMEQIMPFVDWAEENIASFLFSEAYCYSERLHVGGIADVGFILKDGRHILGDHKSGKEVYPDQGIQTALYDLMLEENGGLTKDGQKLFDWKGADGMIIFPFGSNPFTPASFNPKEYRVAAEEVVHLYKLLNK